MNTLLANLEATFSIYLARPIDPAMLATINVGGIALLIPAFLERNRDRIAQGEMSMRRRGS